MIDAQRFSELREVMPGYRAAAVGRLDDQLFVADEQAPRSLAGMRGALLELARGQRAVYDELGGVLDFGAADELLMSANRGYLLLKIHHASGVWVAVWLGAEGNIGYLRVWMRRFLAEIARGAGR